MTVREFPIEDVLSVVTERLLSSIESVHGVLNYLTKEARSVPELTSALHKCSTEVIRQHPRLDPTGPDLAVPVGLLIVLLNDQPKDRKMLIQGWMAKYIFPTFGRTLSLEPMKGIHP